MKVRLLLAGVSACSLATLLFASNASNASAAIQPSCAPAAMIPTAATIPANLPAFGYTALTAKGSDVQLFNMTTGKTQVPTTVGPTVEGNYLKVTPSALVAGSTYELDFSSFCNYGPYPAKPLTFSVVAEAPFPTEIGAASAGPTVVVEDFGTTRYTVKASYALGADWKPWSQVYEFNVLLDGKLVDTKATFTSAQDGISVIGVGWCDGTNASVKTHSIQLRARLPFSANVDSASASADFDCPAPKITTPTGGGAVQPPGSSSSGGSSGTATSSGSGGTEPSGSNGTEASGCSMSALSAPSTSLPLAGLVLGIAALLRRRFSGASAAKRGT